MRIRDRLTRFALCFLLVLLVASACGGSGKETGEIITPAAPAASQPAQPIKQAQQGAGPTVLMDGIGSIAKAQPVNFGEILKAYEGPLASYVRETDAAYQTTLDKEIRLAMEQGAKGKDVEANTEAVGKLIQRAVILNFQRSLAALKAGPSDPTKLSRLTDAAPAAWVVTQRRSNWLGKGTEFPDLFDTLLNKFKLAVEGNDAAARTQAGEQLDHLFTKSLVLSVFFELGGLEEERGKDKEEAAAKRVEASVYYLSIQDEHAKRNPAGAKTVSEQFQHQPEQIDVSLIRNILKVDFKPELADVDPAKLGS